MRLTFKEAQEAIQKQKLWLWRQKNWGSGGRSRWPGIGADEELETTGYQEPGSAADYFDIPNR